MPVKAKHRQVDLCCREGQLWRAGLKLTNAMADLHKAFIAVQVAIAEYRKLVK